MIFNVKADVLFCQILNYMEAVVKSWPRNGTHPNLSRDARSFSQHSYEGKKKGKDKQGVTWQLKKVYSSRLTDLVTNSPLSLLSHSPPILLFHSFSPLTPLK